MLRAAGVSVIGPAHHAEDLPNQDALKVCGHRGGCFISVADGLGSRPYSHVGSGLAVRMAHQHLLTPLDAEGAREGIRGFYQAWLNGLRGIGSEQAASTLLSATCAKDGLCQVWQLGDGLVLFRSEGKFGVLNAERTGFGNETDALGVTRSFSAWRTASFHLSKRGDGVMLMSDGLADDLQPEQLESFFGYMQKAVSRRSKRAAQCWLRDQLVAWPTAQHADDKTIAMIFRDNP